jgi:hypothetical protein
LNALYRLYSAGYDELSGDEEVVFDGVAAHYWGILASQGRMLLTPRRVVYLPMRFRAWPRWLSPWPNRDILQRNRQNLCRSLVAASDRSIPRVPHLRSRTSEQHTVLLSSVVSQDMDAGDHTASGPSIVERALDRSDNNQRDERCQDRKRDVDKHTDEPATGIKPIVGAADH